MDAEENLIKRFAGLLSKTSTQQAISISTHGINQVDYSLTLIARVITDRFVSDQNFISSMHNYWNVHPNTSIKSVGKAIFQINFENTEDYHKVLERGPWLYKQDLVAITTVQSSDDLVSPQVNYIQVWMQMHGIPFDSLNTQEIEEIAATVGTPISPAQQSFINGRHFYKIKINLSTDTPLVDSK